MLSVWYLTAALFRRRALSIFPSDIQFLLYVSGHLQNVLKLSTKGCFVLSGIDTVGLLQSVDLAVDMVKNGDNGISVPDYVDTNVSDKVVRIIQSYVGVVNKMVWRKDGH